MEEIWKDIPNTNGIYQASSLGRIRSVDHIDHRGKPWKGKVLRQFRNGKKGYIGVTIFKKSRKAHRLVCAAFFGEKDQSTHVNHKNGIRDDNRLENLEWCTPQENVRHSFDVLKKKSFGGHKGKTGGLNHNSKKVKATNLLTKEIVLFDSTAQAASSIGLSTGMVPRVCNGVYKSAKGWAFSYV